MIWQLKHTATHMTTLLMKKGSKLEKLIRKKYPKQSQKMSEKTYE